MRPIAYKISQLPQMGGPSRDKAYEEIRNGKLRAVKNGRSTRILASDFESYMAALPAIEPKAAADRAQHGQSRGRAPRRL